MRSRAFSKGFQTDCRGEPADVIDLGVFIVGVRGLMTAVHPYLALDAQVVGGHEVVAEGG